MVSDLACQRIVMFGLAALTVLLTSRTGTLVPGKAADGYYANCADARLAGVTPIMREERGYRSELDTDHNGVACEAFADAH